MAFILNIDTATEIASISISEKDKILDSITNNNQKDHAAFLQPAIKSLLLKIDLPINKLNAIAVTKGPGSYTGLRVGMASAKGLCYALNIPLVTLNTLEVMAWSTMLRIQDSEALYCPMIDARRMEVFTAVYDHQLTEIVNPCAMILDENSFKDLLKTNKIHFSGSGVLKMKNLFQNENIFYDDNKILTFSMGELAWKSYLNGSFSNVFTSSAVYLKEFYTYHPDS
jgi:tRNA threonylcarbamoyladenosine biosynthesis protein TsaB